MLNKFKQHIESKFPLLKEKKLLLAVSGGIDSIVLTDLLNQLGYDVTLAHCNFQLRGIESNLDEQFVIRLAEKLKVKFFTKKFNTKEFAEKEKLSIQLAARKLRYEWFDELKNKHQLDHIITAHHADDNFETFLINLLRGTGLDGLTGIPERNNNIIRPILPFTSLEIKEYANKHKLVWREDSSNIETKYVRNKIRHQVIPILKDLNPNLLNKFINTLENLKGCRDIINDRIEEVHDSIVSKNLENDVIKFDIKNLQKLSNTKAYLYQLLKPYGFTEWNDVHNLLKSQPGKQINSKTYRLLKDRDFLLLSPLMTDASEVNNVYFIQEGDIKFKNNDLELQIEEVELNSLKRREESKNIIFMDKELLKFPLTVRRWKEGDYFYPFGMRGKKKLSKFFKDEKLSILEKEKIWLLCSEDKIIWVIDYRLDDRFKLTEKTRNILKIERL